MSNYGLSSAEHLKPELRHTIQATALRTGLSPHVIRVWEKRYGTVRPTRSDGNQRRYSDEDVNRLSLLNRLTQHGHSIGSVAQLETPQLEALLARVDAGTPAPPLSPAATGSAIDLKDPLSGPRTRAAELLDAAFAAAAAMDGGRLEQVLDLGAVELGVTALLLQVVAPLVERIGAAWQAGDLQIAHEHIASSVLRTHLGAMSRPMSLHPAAPVLLTTTPAGQLHELGALLAGALAATQGWRVIHAGASLPAAEIASAARLNAVVAVALSIVHPATDDALNEELFRLRRLLPAKTDLVVGGRAASAYQETITRIGATRIGSLDEWLAFVRQHPRR